jgi:hypothetical protein
MLERVIGKTVEWRELGYAYQDRLWLRVTIRESGKSTRLSSIVFI